jgi:acyl-CoA reductase-like NAD-dependent aldehyde dehydrogenase
MNIRSINPATGEVNKEFGLFTKKKTLGICKDAYTASHAWREIGVKKRAAHMRRLAVTLRKRKARYAKLITIEMGKPIRQSLSEIEKCAWTAEVYADNAERWLADEPAKTEARKSFVTFEPLGVILSVMPWNFPFWQALRFGIPALIAGNCSVLRHSNMVPMCALAIEETFREAGFPANVFRTVLTDHSTVKAMIESEAVSAVSLTGSSEAGREIARIAGENLKKTVLELGGSDPFIVLDDADIEYAAKKAVESRMICTGQSCIAAKRFIVMKSVAGAFTKAFAEAMAKQKVGNPELRNVGAGPLSGKAAIEKLESQVEDALAKGADAVQGGKRIEGSGYFYEPTVLTGVKKRMKVLSEEVFGPVAPVIAVKDEAGAVKMANDTSYGLGASIWTRNVKRGARIARELQAGNVFVNEIVKSDPRLPFGGIKRSGIGRELSRYGLLEFTNIKSVYIK